LWIPRDAGSGGCPSKHPSTKKIDLAAAMFIKPQPAQCNVIEPDPNHAPPPRFTSRMMYSSAVFVAMLAGGNAFSITKAPQRMTQLKMSSDPWFPNTATSNTVTMDSLK
jgi:hypothetical protein